MVKSITNINRWVAQFGGLLVAALMVMVVIDFTSRGMYKPVPGIDAAAVFVLVFIVYLGLGYCEHKKSHVRIEMLVSKLPLRWARLLNQFSYCIALSIVAVTIYAAGLNALWSFQHGEAVAGPTPLPVSPIKFLLTIGIALYWLQLSVNFAGLFKGESLAKKL